MKCVTVCQPWPWCILHAGKLIENRTWVTPHRGPLLIHAGLSREWLGSAARELGEKGMREPAARDLPFGAIVGVCELVACVERGDAHERWPEQRPWICGPYCWKLENMRAFERPVTFKGALGLFEVPDALVAQQLGWAVSAVPVGSVPREVAGESMFGNPAIVEAGPLPEVQHRARETTGRLFGGGE